jgi:uncharacterized pyridoxamine 5'-phosphate oxidase family protein
MTRVKEFLKKSGPQYFSTVGLDGRPKVRPFQYMLEKEGRLYFCTSNKKNVFSEIRKNPWVEICTMGENFSWIRLSGKVRFADDRDIKAAIQDSNELVKSLYKTPDNPDFEIFYLEDARAVIADFSGSPPEVIEW